MKYLSQLLKRLIPIILIFTSIDVYGCFCTTEPILETYQAADFVAHVRIKKVTKDPNNENYHDVEIDMINMFKGVSVKSLKVLSNKNISCALLPNEGSSWVIFAFKDESGILTFWNCAGSEQIDNKYLKSRFSNNAKNVLKTIDLKLEVLEFFKKGKIQFDNKFRLKTNDYVICTDELDGIKEKNRFAIYELDVNKDLTVEDVRIIRGFRNEELSKKLAECLKANIIVFKGKDKTIPEKTKINIMYFYYPAKDERKSYFSIWLL